MQTESLMATHISILPRGYQLAPLIPARWLMQLLRTARHCHDGHGGSRSPFRPSATPANQSVHASACTTEIDYTCIARHTMLVSAIRVRRAVGHPRGAGRQSGRRALLVHEWHTRRCWCALQTFLESNLTLRRRRQAACIHACRPRLSSRSIIPTRHPV